MSISLEKGQRISLDKPGTQLTDIFMGLGWDAAKGLFGLSRNIDLDASCLVFEGEKHTDTIWFRQLQSKNGFIIHSGDNRTGDGDGDDETITVKLSKIPQNVTTLLFTIHSYEGQTFNKIKNASARLVDSITGNELAKYNLSGSDGGEHTGMVMCRLYRNKNEWKMQAIGMPFDGRTAMDLIDTPQKKERLKNFL